MRGTSLAVRFADVADGGGGGGARRRGAEAEAAATALAGLLRCVCASPRQWRVGLGWVEGVEAICVCVHALHCACTVRLRRARGRAL